MIGFCYRISAIIFFCSFSYLYLQEMTLYLNHFYLVCIICVLMIFLPVNRLWSVDAIIFGNSSETVPFWSIWIYRALISIVYFYAGVAKMNVDWLRGEPLLHWLPK